jgi:hypothetical protein
MVAGCCGGGGRGVERGCSVRRESRLYPGRGPHGGWGVRVELAHPQEPARGMADGCRDATSTLLLHQHCCYINTAATHSRLVSTSLSPTHRHHHSSPSGEVGVQLLVCAIAIGALLVLWVGPSTCACRGPSAWACSTLSSSHTRHTRISTLPLATRYHAKPAHSCGLMKLSGSTVTQPGGYMQREPGPEDSSEYGSPSATVTPTSRSVTSDDGDAWEIGRMGYL